MHATLMHDAQSSIRFGCRRSRRSRPSGRGRRQGSCGWRRRRPCGCRCGWYCLCLCRPRTKGWAYRLIIKGWPFHRTSACGGWCSLFRRRRRCRHRPPLTGQSCQGNPHGQPTAKPANATATPHACPSADFSSVHLNDERKRVLFPTTANSRGQAVKIHGSTTPCPRPPHRQRSLVVPCLLTVPRCINAYA
jgi:hypothetical protein